MRTLRKVLTSVKQKIGIKTIKIVMTNLKPSCGYPGGGSTGGHHGFVQGSKSHSQKICIQAFKIPMIKHQNP